MRDSTDDHPTSSQGWFVRALRTLAGLVLVLLGFPALLAGVIGLIAMQHRDDSGAFTTRLAPLHADGYALVVPDVGTAITRFGLAPVLGTDSGEIRIAIQDSSEPMIMALAPRADVQPYLDGVAHAELTAVGYADGESPVTITAISGERKPAPARDQAFWGLAGTTTLDWHLGPGQPLSLVLLRSDGKPGFDVSMVVSRFPAWLQPATISLLVGGLAALLAGIVLLFMATEPVLVVEAHRMVEFADRIADRLDEIPPGESLAVVRRTRGLDLTGELIPVRPEAFRSAGHTPPELADRWAVDDDDDPDGREPGESPYVYTAT